MIMFDIPAYFLSFSLISAIACQAEIVQDRSSSRDRPTVKSIQQPSPRGDDLVTRDAVCRWAEQAPVLDGKLGDRCWEKAAVVDRFETFWDRSQSSPDGHARIPRLGVRLEGVGYA